MDSIRMTQQERNIEIALMLGWRKYEGLNPKFNNTFETKGNGKIFNLCVDVLLFHSDWKWLMEAVEFVKKIAGISMVTGPTKGAACAIHLDNLESISGQADTLEEATFMAISDFAKKFNKKEI